ncbi:conserved hypothetical protein [uncultured Eubacteriales bacterium]|uniref:Uncharacterized protein n=1 Tax=uncultured Eubacteriales bacterium TaxID=172733 RepID=A0A212J3M0_9FIRM|nr:conserved hypothetical protein [uncultured Eubacteriales bacterium]
MQALSAILGLCFCLAGGGIMDSLGPGWFLFWGVVILGGQLNYWRWRNVSDRKASDPRGAAQNLAHPGEPDRRLHDLGACGCGVRAGSGVDVVSTTEETRRAAYYETREDARTRRKLVYQALKDNGPMTVDELVCYLIRTGEMRSYDRGYVAPRLTELKKDGLVKTGGVRESQRSGKMTAVFMTVDIKRTAPGGNDTESGNTENNSTAKIAQEGGDVNI